MSDVHAKTTLASGTREWTNPETEPELAPVIWISPHAEAVQMIRNNRARKLKQAHTAKLIAAGVTAGLAGAACLFMILRKRVSLPGIPPFGVGRSYPPVDGTENDTDEE